MNGNLWVWRHPRPQGAEGRCIGGRTDLPIHWRRAKRLARRIQALARREHLAHVVWTSPLQRCAEVGEWLHRWGWTHYREAALLELDFGTWDGHAWSDIARSEVDAWVSEFTTYAPGGGESLRELLARAAALQIAAPAILVTHGGWMLARRWLVEHEVGCEPLRASDWPVPPGYARCWRISAVAAQARQAPPRSDGPERSD